MNNFNGIGRIGRDAVTRYTQGGKAVTGWGARFDESGQNTRARPLLAQWQDGRLVTVAPAVRRRSSCWLEGVETMTRCPASDRAIQSSAKSWPKRCASSKTKVEGEVVRAPMKARISGA